MKYSVEMVRPKKFVANFIGMNTSHGPDYLRLETTRLQFRYHSVV